MSRPSAARTHPRGLVRGLSRAAVVRPGAALGTGEGALCVLEGSQLSLTAQRLTSLPALTGKRYGGQAIVTYMRALDASVNALTYALLLGAPLTSLATWSTCRTSRSSRTSRLTTTSSRRRRLAGSGCSALRISRSTITAYGARPASLPLTSQINDLELFLGHLASAAPALKALSLVGNPCVPNVLNAPKQHANYRCTMPVVTTLTPSASTCSPSFHASACSTGSP